MLGLSAGVSVKAVIIGLLLFGCVKAYGLIYDAGYDAAVIEQHKFAIKERDKAVAEAKAIWEKNAGIAAKEIIIEEKIVEKIRVLEKKVPTVVEKIVKVSSECSDLGPDFLMLYNEAVIASSGNESKSTGTSSNTN